MPTASSSCNAGGHVPLWTLFCIWITLVGFLVRSTIWYWQGFCARVCVCVSFLERSWFVVGLCICDAGGVDCTGTCQVCCVFQRLYGMFICYVSLLALVKPVTAQMSAVCVLPSMCTWLLVRLILQTAIPYGPKIWRKLYVTKVNLGVCFSCPPLLAFDS